MMKSLWVIAFFGAGILAGVCNAACFYSPAEKQEGRDPGGCVYEGEIHEYGARWRTKNCYDCNCNSDGSVRCCQAYATPVDYDEQKCIKIWDQEACTFHVVRRNNRRKTCPHAAVG